MTQVANVIKTALHVTPKGRKLGWKPDLPDRRDLMFSMHHNSLAPTPPRLSWRNKFPYVYDQADIGSCTANSGCLAFGAIHGVTKVEDGFSRLMYYYNERDIEGTIDQDSGAEIRDGIKALASKGVCYEKDWVYDTSKYKDKPPVDCFDKAKKLELLKYFRLNTATDYKQCIAQGFAFTFGFTVYESIDSDLLEKTGVMTMPGVQEKVVGGHAVTGIGYDDDFHNNPILQKHGIDPSTVPTRMYEIQNSWNDKWGDIGRFWMPAEYVEDSNMADDFWTLRA